MPDKKITDLTAITTIVDTDVLPIVDVDADETKKITISQVKAQSPVQSVNGSTGAVTVQETLVSGTNIKTINSTSILGSGDITISGGSTDWGDIGGTLSNQTDLQNALDAKQATLVSGTNIKTVNSTSLLGSGDISISANPSGGAGLIQFSDGSAFASDSNLFWDNTNKRLGVGTSTPTDTLTINTGSRYIDFGENGAGGYIQPSNNMSIYSPNSSIFAFFTNSGVGINVNPTARFHVKGSGSTSASTSLLVQNSNSNDIVKVLDDGKITFNSNEFTYALLSGVSIFAAGSGGGGVFDVNPGNRNSVTFRIRGDNDTFLFESQPATDQIGIGTGSPDASAKLQIFSTTKGFLPPRMTTTQKNAISSPAAGLQVYDSTTNRAAVYSTAWENVITETNGSPNSVYKMWSGSQTQYDALTPDSSTVYFIV